ncbi:hypothetical protein [Sphingomonas sp. LY160]|uniref:hypothetical protein n=1 Tax=Sphingomonas sp. LY160 TaxID=3095342 RepID=UPI002ADEAEFC|nr:hypothetical protein [Sphingomonas sp. LY160]MEA1072979.1 hypothetical protein [Sphingomonas sp. LY160]
MQIHTKPVILGTLLLTTLSGCGGGGGSAGVASVPAPPVGPVTPPPPPPTFNGAIALQSPQPFATAGYATRYSAKADGTDARLLSGPAESDTISFRQLPGSNKYELRLPGYEAGELRPIHYNGSVCSNGTVCQPSSTGSRVAVGSSTVLQDALVTIPVPGSNYPGPAFTYTSLATWAGSSPDPAEAGRDIRSEGVFAYGIPTLAGDVPTSGSGTYLALVEGRTTSLGNFIGGDATLKFDFAQGTLSGEMRPLISDGWDLHPMGTYTFTQTVFGVGSTNFSGLLSGPGGGGGFAGQFTGPQADELLARWQAPYISPLDQTTGRMFGVWVGRRQ